MILTWSLCVKTSYCRKHLSNEVVFWPHNSARIRGVARPRAGGLHSTSWLSTVCSAIIIAHDHKPCLDEITLNADCTLPQVRFQNPQFNYIARSCKRLQFMNHGQLTEQVGKTPKLITSTGACKSVCHVQRTSIHAGVSLFKGLSCICLLYVGCIQGL